MLETLNRKVMFKSRLSLFFLSLLQDMILKRTWFLEFPLPCFSATGIYMVGTVSSFTRTQKPTNMHSDKIVWLNAGSNMRYYSA